MRETGLQSFERCFSLFEWECLGVIYVRVSERKAIKNGGRNTNLKYVVLKWIYWCSVIRAPLERVCWISVNCVSFENISNLPLKAADPATFDGDERARGRRHNVLHYTYVFGETAQHPNFKRRSCCLEKPLQWCFVSCMFFLFWSLKNLKKCSLPIVCRGIGQSASCYTGGPCKKLAWPIEPH